MDQDGKVMGFQQILTAEYMGNLDREKVTEQVVGYGDREAEMNRAMANLPKPWLQWATLIASVIGFIILGVLSFLIYSRLGDAVIQTTGG
jgi:large-conductance mechanosensitive channel